MSLSQPTYTAFHSASRCPEAAAAGSQSDHIRRQNSTRQASHSSLSTLDSNMPVALGMGLRGSEGRGPYIQITS